jgi:transposase
VPSAVIAAGLRVSERPVRGGRQAWQAAGPAGPASRGQAARCRQDQQPAALAAGPGWTGQRWTLARIQDLIAATFKVAYTIPGIWYLLRCRGWTYQIGARRANERDDGAVEAWKETWPQITAPRWPAASCRAYWSHS